MKNKAAVELGRMGSLARKDNLTPEELSAIGKHAARVRWKKKRAAESNGKREKVNGLKASGSRASVEVSR